MMCVLGVLGIDVWVPKTFHLLVGGVSCVICMGSTELYGLECLRNPLGKKEIRSCSVAIIAVRY